MKVGTFAPNDGSPTMVCPCLVDMLTLTELQFGINNIKAEDDVK